MQLMQVVMPQIERLSKEGQAGSEENHAIHALHDHWYCHCAVDGHRHLFGADEDHWRNRCGDRSWLGLSDDDGDHHDCGCLFVMWLGEQITDRGIGNGASLIITCGIIAALPSGMNTYQKVTIGEITLLGVVLLLGFMIASLWRLYLSSAGNDVCPIQYAKRVVGRRVYGGQQLTFR